MWEKTSWENSPPWQTSSHNSAKKSSLISGERSFGHCLIV